MYNSHSYTWLNHIYYNQKYCNQKTKHYISTNKYGVHVIKMLDSNNILVNNKTVVLYPRTGYMAAVAIPHIFPSSLAT